MSFGDISPLRRAPASSLLQPHRLPSRSLTPDAQLRGTLNALAANNATLRRTSDLLRSPNKLLHPPLNRVRQLRKQNRDIARAAANFAHSVEEDTTRQEFQKLVEEFTDALRESVEAETDALEMESAAREVATTQWSEGHVALQVEDEEKKLVNAPPLGEKDALLQKTAPRTAKEAATLRELQVTDSYVRERNAMLTEIQSSVDDVNSIFRDLAIMVGDQQTQIDYIDVSVEDTAENVANARRELLRTQRRRERRKSMFFCTLLSIAAIIVLFFVIVLK